MNLSIYSTNLYKELLDAVDQRVKQIVTVFNLAESNGTTDTLIIASSTAAITTNYSFHNTQYVPETVLNFFHI